MPAYNNYPLLSISSQTLVASIPTAYLFVSLLVCLRTFRYTCLHRRPNCPVVTVNSNYPKSQNSHQLNFQWLYLDNLILRIYISRLGAPPLSSATPSYPMPPKISKQNIYQLPTVNMWTNSSCISTFPRWVGVGVGGWVVIIKLKANLILSGTGLPTGTELGNTILN